MIWLGLVIGGCFILGLAAGVLWSARRLPVLLAAMSSSQIHDLAGRVDEARKGG